MLETERFHGNEGFDGNVRKQFSNCSYPEFPVLKRFRTSHRYQYFYLSTSSRDRCDRIDHLQLQLRLSLSCVAWLRRLQLQESSNTNYVETSDVSVWTVPALVCILAIPTLCVQNRDIADYCYNVDYDRMHRVVKYSRRSTYSVPLL